MNAPISHASTERLERRLREPDRGESGYERYLQEHAGDPVAGTPRSRIPAILAGRVAERPAFRGTNTHLHTNKSFSIFGSPSEAAWRAWLEGVQVVGINDHYTIEGHPEFREACAGLDLRATFGIEAVALDGDCAARGIRLNDPGNPGRTYFSGKGVFRDLDPGGPGFRDLASMRRALEERNRAMVARINDVLEARAVDVRISFEEALALTPHGNTTERHVCQALAEALVRRYPDPQERAAAAGRLGVPDPAGALETDAAFQNALRAALVKAGRPAYVEESPRAFLSVPRMRSLFLEYGAVPTYPILGNPVTEFEKDPAELFDRLEAWGIFAVEVIPHRNTRERLEAILAEAERRSFPVSNGTEHNTKTPMPMIDDLSADPVFRPVFLRGARVLLAHQWLAPSGGLPFVDGDGNPVIGDPALRLRFFAFAGRLAWSDREAGILRRWPASRVVALTSWLYVALGGDPDGPDLRVGSRLEWGDALERELDQHPLDPRRERPRGELPPILRRSLGS